MTAEDLLRVRLGATKMLISDKDKDWLPRQYTGLKYAQNEIFGTIEFTANYNSDTGQFRVIGSSAPDMVGGLTLSGKYKVKIKERINNPFSRLPAIYADEVEPVQARHFNQSDKSACLCSPFEEEEFLVPEFLFQPFFTKLVIPFLYGQSFYSAKGYWPWPEYSHGIVGLLESYSRVNDSSKAKDFLEKSLKQDKETWERVRSAIKQKSEIKGHTPCFCSKKDHIRRCHPDAWKGIIKLRKDIKDQNIII